MKRKPGKVVPIRPGLIRQIERLIAARDAEPELGFMVRTMALCSMPRSNPGAQLRYVRRNGPYSLHMIAGADNKLPFGTLPRLLMSWICGEVVRTGNRELVLGKSLGEFMRELGIYSSSGQKHSRVREQMLRLFGCAVSMVYADDNRKTTAATMLADLTDFWWDPKRPDQPALWESRVKLSEPFFNEIVSHPVPLEMNTLGALKRSSLGLDLYLWLTYRTFTLDAPLRLTWPQLYRQLGARPDAASNNNTVQAFRYKVLRELKKIKTAWPELNYSTKKGVLILYPLTPKIQPSSGARQLTE